VNDTAVIVGVDSAERTGIAVICGARILRRGLCEVNDWQAVERAADTIATFKPEVVAIEDVFVRLNNSTGLVLSRLLGRWLQAFERRGLATVTVLASTWQPVILAGRMTTRTPGPERKLACIAWALERFGIALPEDQADACAIAAWAQRSGLGPRTPSGPAAGRHAQTGAT
jgi:Holliday junction resolvasome RuvABC endonuclease subunit